MVHDTLLYRRRVGCHACNGDGVWREPYPCPACEGKGWRWMYRAPTAADLLTDPRLRALVEALSGAVGTLADHGQWQASEAAVTALAPFEEARRG